MCFLFCSQGVFFLEWGSRIEPGLKWFHRDANSRNLSRRWAVAVVLVEPETSRLHGRLGFPITSLSAHPEIERIGSVLYQQRGLRHKKIFLSV